VLFRSWHIGSILHRSEEKQNKYAYIKTYYYQTQHDKFIIEVNKYNKKINMPKMITNLTEIEERNESIVKIIQDILVGEPSRKIFILTNRRNHIDTLNNLIKEAIKDVSLGIYIGGMKKEELKLSEEKQIILGTYEMASEGLDIQDLDTLILATPKSNITQSIGRIMRKEKHEYTSIPLVIDIVDRLDIFYGMYNKRKKTYKKNNFNIDTFNINKNIIENNKSNSNNSNNSDVTNSDNVLFID
jgi:superfamily II DNA or RNA helicase